MYLQSKPHGDYKGGSGRKLPLFCIQNGYYNHRGAWEDIKC